MTTSELSLRELRNFGLIFAALLALVAGVLLPWLWSFGWPRWPWLLAGLIAACALLRPAWLRGPYRYWMKFGHALGWFNTRLLLGLVFFLLFVPFGLIARLFGKDPLHKGFDPAATTYRVPSVARPPSHMERPF